MSISEIIHGGSFDCFMGEVLRIGAECSAPIVIVDPCKVAVEVAPHVRAELVLMHTRAESGAVHIALMEGAILSVTQIFTAEAFVEVEVRQLAQSVFKGVVTQLTSANVAYKIDLDGRDAECNLNGLFLAAECDHCEVSVRVNHNQPHCRSNSFVKGVAGGSATGVFRGLVYVAKDAQHTDARQQSRNILLSHEARITTKPQLEIYADDVKCSHGATVGQMDVDAILYMRQRGLSEAQARVLQLEGFVGEVVNGCSIESLREWLRESVTDKLHKM